MGRSIVQGSHAGCGVCVTECDQVQQEPPTPTMSRYKEVALRKREERKKGLFTNALGSSGCTVSDGQMISWNVRHRSISGVFRRVGNDEHEHVSLGSRRDINYRVGKWKEYG